MASDKLRRQIVFEAARLMYQRQESEYYRAKLMAARKICNGRVKPSDLPSNREIRDEILRFSSIYDVVGEAEGHIDRFVVYRTLLIPLSRIKLDVEYHPEGDVLYHSLQVFELVRDEFPYDEEFLLAALLHDVGKGLDPQEHVVAGLAALGDAITERTAWFIENHSYAHAFSRGQSASAPAGGCNSRRTSTRCSRWAAATATAASPASRFPSSTRRSIAFAS